MNRPHTLRRRRAALLAMAASLIVAGFGAPSSAEGPVSRRNAPRQEDGSDPSLKSQYDEVLGREAALLRRLDAAQRAKRKVQAEVDDLARKTTSAQLALLAAQERFADARRVAQIQAIARKRADQRVKRAIGRLREQAVASFVRGGEDGGVMEALLKARNGEQAGQALAYGHAVVGDTERLLQELERARAARRKAERSAKKAQAKAETERKRIEDSTRFLAAARDQKKTLLAEQEVKVRAEQEALRQVQTRKALVQGRILAMNKESDGVGGFLSQIQAGQPDFELGAVTLSHPIPGVRVSSPYGMRHHPILGIDRLHAGADLGSPSGTEIHAAADGVVVIAGVRGGYGNATVIDHGNSLATLYGHQSQLLVEVGDVVKRGDVIGLVGSTGLSTGPHLHFETRVRGLPINPEGLVDFTVPSDYYTTSTTTTTR